MARRESGGAAKAAERGEKMRLGRTSRPPPFPFLRFCWGAGRPMKRPTAPHFPAVAIPFLRFLWGGGGPFLARKAPRIATHHPAIPQRFFGAMKKVAGGAAFAKEVPIRKIRKGETSLLCQRRAAILTAARRFPARRPAIAAGDAGGLKIFHALHISSSFF